MASNLSGDPSKNDWGQLFNYQQQLISQED